MEKEREREREREKTDDKTTPNRDVGKKFVKSKVFKEHGKKNDESRARE